MNDRRLSKERVVRVARLRWGQVGAGVLRRRWFSRAPIRVFDAGLGYLFAGRLLMLEHTGRRTGLPRRVVLEVVDRSSSDTYLVASGFGTESQWLRNIEACPDVHVWVGRQRGVPGRAVSLPRDETVAAVDRYANRHRIAWALLRPVFEATLAAPVSEIPIVAIALSPSRG